MDVSSGPPAPFFYATLAALLLASLGGYAYFASDRPVRERRRWFPAYMHLCSAIFLIVPVTLGSWPASVVFAPIVALLDRMWLVQVRFCDSCGQYHPARGLPGPYKSCTRCHAPLTVTN